MKFILTDFHFSEIIKKGYDLNMIFLLRLISDQADLSALVKESAKIDALHHSLIRKGLITEDDKLTTQGTELLTFMDTKAPGKLIRKKIDETAFAQWWKEFPGSSNFVHKGVTFSGDRGLKKSESDCRVKFNAIVAEGEYTAQELIDAMKYDVWQKKEMSVKTGVNKLQYLQNSLTYLNQRSYEGFMDQIKSGHKPTETPTPFNGTDI